MDRILRMREIESRLFSEDGLKIRQLAKELDVSDKTIRRDLRTLESVSGKETWYDDSKLATWYVDNDGLLFNHAE